MPDIHPTPLYRRSFDAASLLREHPPQIRHPHKSALLKLAQAERSTGTIEVTRWAAEVPTSIALPEIAVDVRPDFFDYVPVDPAATEWHVEKNVSFWIE